MENIISVAAEFAENIADFFKGYFCFLPLLLLVAHLVAFALALQSKTFRYADKSVFNAITSALAFFHFAIGVVAFKKTAEFFVSLILFGLCYAAQAVISALSEIKIRLSAREKRLIGRLSEPKEILSTHGKIEFLNGTEISDDIEPNFNEIKKITAALKEKELTPQEEDEIDKAEMDMEKYSTRAIQPFERKIFSERLLKIVKMTSKYELDVTRL